MPCSLLNPNLDPLKDLSFSQHFGRRTLLLTLAGHSAFLSSLGDGDPDSMP